MADQQPSTIDNQSVNSFEDVQEILNSAGAPSASSTGLQASSASGPAPRPNPSRAPTPQNINLDGPTLNKECDTLVQRFRSGDLSKGDAILEIIKVLTREDGSSTVATSKAVESYVGIITNFESFRDRAGRSGARDIDVVGGADGYHPGDAGGPGFEGERPSQNALGGFAGKRPRSPSSDVDGEDSTRRPRLDVEALPWMEGERTCRSPELEKTRSALENIARDVKRAKALLINSPRCPQFPTNLWNQVLGGEYVDLDRVLSGMYALSVDEQRKERVGSLEFTVGATTPAKRVRSHSDWITAWDSYERAVVYVFPHRKRELTQYAENIRQLFAGYADARHQSVIDYDKAVRIKVAQTLAQLLPPTATDRGQTRDGAHPGEKHAGDGTRESARMGAIPAVTPTSVPNAGPPDMSLEIVEDLLPESDFLDDSESPTFRARPSYARSLMWNDDSTQLSPTLIQATEFLAPFPPVPHHELHNRQAVQTIIDNPHLFKIVTPIRSQVLRRLLRTHPNTPLVHSVVKALEIGAWPYADTSRQHFPITLLHPPSPQEKDHLDFILEFRRKEVAEGRFSEPFRKLLPGMLTVPYVIAERNGKHRFCVNHSASPYSRNDMIDKANASVPLDGLQEFGRILRRVRRDHGDASRLVVWKSDVSKAYRRIPLHPCWQIKQIVTINGEHYIDRNNNFGNRAAGRIWGTIIGLVLWIAAHVLFILDLLCWVDDVYSWDFEGNVLTYRGYDDPITLPAKQVRLLELWDTIGVPHEREKQLYGSVLTVIGFEVDPNAMTITISEDRKQELISAIDEFILPVNHRHALVEFQRLTGWMNWVLNVTPLLRPGLCAMYEKMAGKTIPWAKVSVNNAIRTELRWFASHLRASNGVHIMTSVEWPIQTATLTIYCDASFIAMGFWVPSIHSAFRHHINQRWVREKGIFYWEALTVVSALHWSATRMRTVPQRLVIFTDNMNTVTMFNSLRANAKYNSLLLHAADTLMATGIQLRVVHVPGEQNVIADAVSRSEVNSFSLQFGDTTVPIHYFTPPPIGLGATL